MPEKRWEQVELDELLTKLKTDREEGLAVEEAGARLARAGRNVLMRQKEVGVLGKVLRQFRSPLVFILLGAGIVTVILQEFLDAIVIGVALIINVVVGTFQEERASKAFEKLNQTQEQRALVIRDGKKMNILAQELVPGDLVILEGGYHVPADVRITQEKDLTINEAALTGEWVAVSKDACVIEGDVPLAERRNMAWMGTLIASGYGRGIVVETGSNTQVGMIATELGSIEDEATPLQLNIRSVARFLSYVIVAAILGIFVLGVVQEQTLIDMLLISIAVAVATIPSGLPAAVTVVLALGMEAILKRGGLVRNLLAAETLGSTTIILTDKTGTLTEAKMHLAAIYTHQSLTADGPGEELLMEDDRAVLKSAVLVSDAFIEEAQDAPRKLTVHGNPLEKAVVLAGLEAGISQDEIEHTQTRIDYLQFESERRFGASLNACPHCRGKQRRRVHITGAPEILLERATYVLKNGRKAKLTQADRARFREALDARSSEGMRLIGASYKDVAWEQLPEREEDARTITDDSVYLGFMAFEDPVRKDVAEAIDKVKGAGAQVIMITGDNPQTAAKIAGDVGILYGSAEVIRGEVIEELTDNELYQRLQSVRVIARALPQHKLRIARVLKNEGEVIAMTGDGINDAPALRAASIGVAVGSGTEVAKESADLILINNSFSIIVAAVEEGRRIIDNLKKIIAYLLSTSFSEIFVIGGALISGSPLPLLPAQILWANIVEEGLMSFSFAFEKVDPNVMKRNPRSSVAKNIMTRELRSLIFVVSVITGVFLIALYFFLLNYLQVPIDEVRTIMFVSLSLDAIFFSFSLKSLDRPVWKINPFTNRYLLVALVSSLLVLLAAITLPPLKTLLTLTDLTAFEGALLLGVGLFNLLTIEVTKYVLFERKRK